MQILYLEENIQRNPAAAVAAYPSDISLNSVSLIKMVGCSRLNCDACSACLQEFYCCAECQKKDWKVHKIVCHLVKQMPDMRRQSFKDVCSVVNTALEQSEEQMFKLGRKKYIRLLQHTETYVEIQFGKQVAGKASYERDNGDSIDNWTIEICVLLKI
jgi:hypothetical protein